jgi:hypothetical protein
MLLAAFAASKAAFTASIRAEELLLLQGEDD